jgi:hypothetical protein
LVAIFTALAVVVAACGEPIPPAETHTLTVNVGGDGTGSVRFDAADGENAAGASEHEAGTEVTLVAAPGDDSVFGGWGGACSGADPQCVVTMDADKTVTATFTAEPQVPAEVQLNVDFTGSTGGGTIEQAELGIACTFAPGAGATGACGPVTASTSTAYTFTATPATDMEFAGWAGDADAACDDANTTCAVTPDQDPFVVVAVFSDPNAGAPVSGSVAIAGTQDDGFEWRADASGATGVPADVEGNTYNELRQIGLSYLFRYGVEVVSGFAFRDLEIPRGATVQEAYIQFTSIVRENGSGPSGSYDPSDGQPVTLKINVEDSLDPAPIPSRDPGPPFPNNLSSRTLVPDATVDWDVPDWADHGEAGPAQQTPDLSALLQKLVDKGGWTQGDSDVMFIVSNADDSPETGWRQVADFSETDGDPGEFAAVLHYSYTLPGP